MDVVLRIQRRLDSKWLKTDLQRLSDAEGVAQLWNEMVKDGEVTGSFSDGLLNAAGFTARKGENGHYYCGMKVLSCPCCDGICGPNTGCNCGPCQQLDREEEARRFSSTNATVISSMVHQNWAWGRNQNFSLLRDCLEALVKEQKHSGVEHASNSLWASLLWRRLNIIYRYYIALGHQDPDKVAKTVNNRISIAGDTKIQNTKKLYRAKSSSLTSTMSQSATTSGLASVGSRTALNFAFAFLRRAWRSGEDTDLCNQVLRETLEALRALPQASLFDDTSVSSIWLEVIDKSEKFLESVAAGNVGGGDIESAIKIPLEDQCLALCILLELAFQRGTLSRLLDCVLLLLEISPFVSDNCNSREDKFNAPLVPFLRRFENISSKDLKLPDKDILSDEIPYLSEKMSPTQSYLYFSSLSDDDEEEVNIRKAGVFVMSHLDRLGALFRPPHTFNKNPFYGQWQEVLTMGCLGWGSFYSGAFAPQLCDILGELGVKQICCAERSLLISTHHGKVYSIYYNSEAQCPQLCEGFGDKEIIKIATYPDSKHYLALTSDGQVFSWGCGDGGRLGHGDTCSKEEPTLIEGLVGKAVVHIACGSTYSAAITNQGELYTWGRGTYGRLGHGNSDDQTVPVLVTALRWHNIVDVACGSGDAQTLAVTSTGAVFSWGDGDYGKLGRGGSESCKTPKIIEHFDGIVIEKVYCGAQFSLALARDGSVYSWGKGDNFRLGLGTDEHIRFPKKIESLAGKVVKKLGVGSMHVLALTDAGEVWGWGRNELGQLGDLCGTYIEEPTCIQSLKGRPIVGVACGPSQSFVWSSSSEWSVDTYVPFIVQVSCKTLEQLDSVLDKVWFALEESTDHHQSSSEQDAECIAVSALNLLKLQLFSILSHSLNLESVGIAAGQPLLFNLKTKVVHLASSYGVLSSVQESAQSVLQMCWSLLLPTADERARALSSLLPSSTDLTSLYPGRRFMVDLLVASLTADGGLEASLDEAINAEVQDWLERLEMCSGSVEMKGHCCDSSDQQPLSESQLQGLEHENLLSNEAIQEIQEKREQREIKPDVAQVSADGDDQIALLNLVQQLLKNASVITLNQLQTSCNSCSVSLSTSGIAPVPITVSSDINGAFSGLDTDESSCKNMETSPSLQLLLKFQRLLITKIVSQQQSIRSGDSSHAKYIIGAERLLGKYVQDLTNHLMEIIAFATVVAGENKRTYATVSSILAEDISGVLFPELMLSLVLIGVGSDRLSCLSPSPLNLENPLKDCNLKPSLSGDCLGRAFLRRARFIEPLISLLDCLNHFNKLAPAWEKDDNEIMGWPGIMIPATVVPQQQESDDIPWFRKADIENHNKDDGFWTLFESKIYDSQDARIGSTSYIERSVLKDGMQKVDDTVIQPFSRFRADTAMHSASCSEDD